MADAPDRQPPGADAGAPAPVDLGARITALREAAGMSVDDVAARTRIRGSLIRSMEAGDFAPCGGAVYARGHLRSIAHVVGGDDAALVAGYDRMAGLPSPSAAAMVPVEAEVPAAHVPFASVAGRPLPPTAPPAAQPAPRPPTLLTGTGTGTGGARRSPLVLAGVVVAAAVVVVAAVALALPHASHRAVVTARSSTHSPAAGALPSTPPLTPTAPATLAAAGVNVTVNVAGNASWVHVTDGSGAVVFQGLLDAGASKAFHAADQLRFVFGYAPAIHLVVNGHDVGAPPPTAGGGDVADAVFNATSAG